MEEIRKKCFAVMKDKDKCGNLVKKIFNHHTEDYDETIGFYLLKAYIENDMDGVIKAISGYDMESLLEDQLIKTHLT